MTTLTTHSLLIMLVPVLLAVLLQASGSDSGPAPSNDPPAEKERPVHVHYLEIVTPDVDATCAALEAMHATTFGPPNPMFGNARTAPLVGGGLLGVRAPMRETEEPVVRPYVLVDDIKAAVAAAEKGGAEVAMAPTPIPGQGTFAIYLQGGIQHGLWQR